MQQALAALLKQEDSRADEALSPKSDASVKSRPDDADANPHSESAPGRPGRAASQRSLLMALLERVAAKVKA